MATKAVKVKLSELVLDYSFYPRGEQKVDPYHVRRMKESLKAGFTLPPPIVDRASKRVVDGFHRITAMRAVLEDDPEINVILKDYANEAEMFLEAAALNATHGRSLTTYDRLRCLMLAEKFHIEALAIAKALHIAPEQAVEMRKTRFALFEGEAIPLKRTMSHLAGEGLTQQQMDFLPKAGGMPPVFYVQQLIRLVEADAMDWEDARLLVLVQRLHVLLSEKVAVKV